jgi:hypothetical protein
METVTLPTVVSQSSLDRHETGTTALEACRRKRRLIPGLVNKHQMGSQDAQIQALRAHRARFIHRIIHCRVHRRITRRMAIDTRITDGVQQMLGAFVSSSLGTGATPAKCIVTVFLSAVICREIIWRTSNRFHRS